MITVVAAVSRNGYIGRDNRLLWSLPSDMKHFRDTTFGGTVVMGRKTYESIGRPLPGRRNIVVSRNTDLKIEGVEVVSSLDTAFDACSRECFVIGGSQIYEMALPVSDRLLLTHVDEDFDGDAKFPDHTHGWIKVSERRVEADERNAYPHTFAEYEMCKF